MASQKPWQESIASIVSRRAKFDNYPPFQRDKVWTRSKNQRLIDSILRGWPIGEIVVAEDQSPLRGSWYWVLDGQQRLTAILRFAQNEFATAARKWGNEMAGTPIEGGRRYAELTPETRDRFDDYTLTFRATDNVSWQSIGDVFRRLQEGEKMSVGEKLWSYQSPAVVAAFERLGSSRYFREIYSGRNGRKEIIKALCYLLLSDKRGVYGNLSRDSVHALAQSDQRPSEEQLARLERQLDAIVHLFQGYQTKGLMEIVILAQAVHILETEHCDIYKSAEGCCAVWWAKAWVDSRGPINGSPTKTLPDWDEASGQAGFWLIHGMELLTLDGLRFRDPRRTFSEIEKIKAWARQDGACAGCGKRVFLGQAVGHHGDPWADGGPTQQENCVVFHPDCHERYHAGQMELPQT